MFPRTGVIVALLLLLAVAVRWPGLTDPPLTFHPTRQYRAAMIARGYAIDVVHAPDPAARKAAELVAKMQLPLEPPVMEHLAAWTYRLTGGETLRRARAWPVIAWSVGGLFLFLLARLFVSEAASLAAAAIFLFVPYSIVASQSFQVDPLMTALIVVTLFTTARYVRNPSALGAVALFLAAGAAFLAKAMAIFFLLPGVIVLLSSRGVSLRTRLVASLLVLVSWIPGGVYYATLKLMTDYGPFPQLFTEAVFWRGWGAILVRVATWPVLLLAAAGLVAARGELRRLLWLLLLAYAAFGFIFTYAIYTHDYYSLPIIPVVALSAAAVLDRLEQWLGASLVSRIPAALTSLWCIALGVVATAEATAPDRRGPLRAEAARYERIGALTHHSDRVVTLDGSYGAPLAYHGFLVPINLPLSIDLSFARMKGQNPPDPADLLKSFNGEFFVCTLQAELDAQPNLLELLQRRYQLLERDGTPERWSYVVYDLRHRILSVAPARVSLIARAGNPVPVEETVTFSAGEDTEWRVDVPADAGFEVEPAAGRGDATLRLRATPAPTPGDRTAKVVVHTTSGGSAAIDVLYRTIGGPDQPPFGAVDAPPDPVSRGSGELVLQGWALDDLGLARVRAVYVTPDGREVPLGDARPGGRRPDVAAIFPGAAGLNHSAWAVVIEGAVHATFASGGHLRVFAEDSTGQRAEIGSRRIR